MKNLLDDLWHGAKALAKRPVFTLVGVVSLALGLGANAAIFSASSTLFLRPLPVEEPERLVALYARSEENPGLLLVSWPNYRDFRDQNQSLSGLAIHQQLSVDLVTGGDPRQIRALLVSGNYFDVLGVRAAVGRTFRPEEDTTPGTHPVVVLSHSLWRDHFASASDIVGETILLNRNAFTVIGVAPPEFTGVDLETLPDLWVPTMSYPHVLWKGSAFLRAIDHRRSFFFNMVGRLAPGASVEQARADLDVVARRLQLEYPDENRGRTLAIQPLVEAYVSPDRAIYGRYRLALGLLIAVAGVVLLVGCGNTAHLLLVRATERRREIALRRALGAGQVAASGQLFAESLLLSLLGGGVGLALAAAVRPLLLLTQAPLLQPIVSRLDFGLGAAAFTLGLALLTGLVTGLVPLVRTSRADLVSDLKGLVGASGRSPWYAGRHLLVMGQVALALVALIFAGLFVRSLRVALETEPGFETAHTGILRFTVGSLGYTATDGLEFYERALRQAARMPGVSAASLGRAVPLGDEHVYRTVYPEAQVQEGSQGGVFLAGSIVTPGYFETLGLPILEGRDFDSRDGDGSPPVMIVNQTFATTFYPGRNLIGQDLRFGGEQASRRIVGVVADSKYLSLQEDPLAYMYLPLAQNYTPTMTLFVRAAQSPVPVLGAVREAVQELDPMLPLTDVTTLTQVLSRSLWASRLGASLVGLFGIFTLVLSAMGLYSVMSYTVRQRYREVGIRMALGAPPASVLGNIFTSGMVRVGLGLAAGLLIAVLTTRLVANLLYGISTLDLAAFTGVVVLLLAVAAVAILVPAWRALTVDPVTVLRQE